MKFRPLLILATAAGLTLALGGDSAAPNSGRYVVISTRLTIASGGLQNFDTALKFDTVTGDAWVLYSSLRTNAAGGNTIWHRWSPVEPNSTDPGETTPHVPR